MIPSLIDSASHIVLIAHKNPDADSLGSACAFYSYLLRKEKKITLFCASSHINPHLAFLPWYDKVTDRFPEEADLLISFDCGSIGRLGIQRDIPLINVDHHVSNERFGTQNLINSTAISTSEVVYDYFVANGIKINGKMALSLYAGLVDDSKCFSAPECNAKTFQMARDLVEWGADHAVCIEWLYRRRSLSSMRIRGALLKGMKLFSDGRFAIFEASLPLLQETGATVGECKSVLDDALGMRCVEAVMICIEHPQGGVKLSLRTNGSIDASKIMGEFGGGGHKKRAGARITDREHIDELVQSVKAMIIKELA